MESPLRLFDEREAPQAFLVGDAVVAAARRDVLRAIEAQRERGLLESVKWSARARGP